MITFSAPTLTDPDPLDAFLAHAPYSLMGYGAPGGEGALSGYTLGIKDLFDVAGLKTGAGSPVWLSNAGPAPVHAPAVAALLSAGARFVGKTLTDELAWSLNGENAHYGTPINPAASGRIPGGSSAGSAAAVAGELIAIGLGSDTGGSVRLPASYCGIWGLRPTHGRISLQGAVPLAPSFDTVGWFARDPGLMARVGDVLLDDGGISVPLSRLLLAKDAFRRLDDDLADRLTIVAELMAARLGLSCEAVELAGEGGLSVWRNVFRVCQSAEALQAHGAWVEAEQPALGSGIADRFAYAKSLSADTVAEARAQREDIRSHLRGLIGPGTVLIVPGAAGVAPLRGLSGPALDDVRARALDILSPAGLAGLPQLAVPALNLADGPIGLGLIGWAGGDEALLALAENLEGLAS